MPKFRYVASVAFEVEVTDEEINQFLNENIADGYNVSDWDRSEIAHEIAGEKLNKLTFAEASWDNVHDSYEIDEKGQEIKE